MESRNTPLCEKFTRVTGGGLAHGCLSTRPCPAQLSPTSTIWTHHRQIGQLPPSGLLLILSLPLYTAKGIKAKLQPLLEASWDISKGLAQPRHTPLGGRKRSALESDKMTFYTVPVGPPESSGPRPCPEEVSHLLCLPVFSSHRAPSQLAIASRQPLQSPRGSESLQKQLCHTQATQLPWPPRYPALSPQLAREGKLAEALWAHLPGTEFREWKVMRRIQETHHLPSQARRLQ